MKNSSVSVAATPEAIRRCHPVMRELRTHLHNAERFVERVQRQQKGGYLLAFLESEGEVPAVAGYRYLESLFSGKFLYVDDLVTRAVARSVSAVNSLTGWWNSHANMAAKASSSIPVCSASTPIVSIWSNA